MFSAPAAGGETLKPADLEGHLLVVEPEEYVPTVTTSFGDKDAIRVTVHDITAQTTTESVLWFSGMLVGSLKSRIGHKVLAVMGKGSAKPGQSAPWILTDASGNDKAVTAATAYLTGQTSAQLVEPAPAKKGKTPPASDLDAALANLAAAGLTA
jgi:hypothetical protein